ncbi:DMT family transporter [Fusibacter bizertensis]
MKTNGRTFAIVCVVIASLLWSSGGLLIKMVSWHPIAISGMRSGISSLVMLAFYVAVYKKLPQKPNKYVLIAAVNYMVLVMLFVSANKLTTSANAILLQFTAPAWAMLIGALFFKAHFSKNDVLTVVVVFLGMTLFFIGDIKSGSLVGNALAVMSGISMALMIISLKYIKGRKPIEIIIWGNMLSFIVAIPFYSGIALTSVNITGVILLGVFQLGLSYIFFTKGIENVSVLEGILIPVLEPLLNPFWVFLGTGEKPSVFAFIGGAIVLTAVIYHSIVEVKAE